jgi:asparagine synthase (glutamine-hydrolysing)
MCGIVAIWSSGGGLLPGDLAAPVRALRHRGPDGLGTWVSPSGDAALGNTRLAVIDLETGDQPISDVSGRYHLVANGEFYGYEAIRAELLDRGHRLRTRTDSEIALHLYAEDGWHALDRLRGEFAFVIWDERRGELFAARDRFGIKPLYYTEHRGRLYLASEVKALLACGVAARWDMGAFADHLLLCYPADRTLFAGVRQVPPGCYLLASADGIVIRRYWDLDYPEASELPAMDDADAHLGDIESAVRDAVLIRMRADVPVAYHLSGGVDSSSVAALAAAAGEVHAFTVRFDDPGFDESAVAHRTSARLGARLTEVRFGRAEFADRIDETIACGEMIQENSHGIARLMQSAAISAHGYKVVLAGEGGDEMFAGYPHFRKDLAFSQSAEVRALAQRSYARLGAHGPPHHMRVFLDHLSFVPNWIIDRYLTVTLPLLPLLRQPFARLLTARQPGEELIGGSDTAGQLRGRTPYHQSMYLFCKTWLCNYILAAERLDMAHAVETRLPFLDHHVADVAKWTPLAWYMRDGVSKAVLREAMRRHLPDEVYRAAKKPFFAPAAVENDVAFARLRRIVDDDVLHRQPFFDPGRVRSFFDTIQAESAARRGRHERVAQIVAGTCLLAETFGLDHTGTAEKE